MRRRTRQSSRGRAAAYRQRREERLAAVERPAREAAAAAAWEAPLVRRTSGAWRPSYLRPPSHRRRAVVSGVISALLHLSSVTLFTIVIYLPRREPEFLEFSFVEAPETLAAASGGEQLRLGNVRFDGEEEGWAGRVSARLKVPLELPTLEFAEIGRLRMRQLTANPMPREELPGLFSLIDPLGSLEAGLSRLRGGEGDRGDARERGPTSEFRPAPGLRAWVEWRGAGARALLYAPPIQALRDASLETPLEFVIQVNSTGRVVNVWTPVLDGGALVDAIQLALLRYRFEGSEGEEIATGTLHIAPEESAP